MNSSQLLVDKAPKVKAVAKAIVHWVNKQGADSHCLARIFLVDSGITVIVSQIRCHPDNSYISSGMATIAEQLYKEFPSKMTLSPEKVVWIKHYGEFSSFDGIEPENFCELSVDYLNGKFEVIETSPSLTSQQVAERLGHLDIKNIYDDLDEIGWTKHLGGVRYSEKALQILAARKTKRLAKEFQNL